MKHSLWIASLICLLLTSTQASAQEPRHRTLQIDVAPSQSLMRDRAAKQPASMRAETRLRTHMRGVLEAGNLGLTDNETKKIEDRMIHLLHSYVGTPDEAKDALYERGEQEVLSIIDPPAKPRTASASGNTCNS